MVYILLVGRCEVLTIVRMQNVTECRIRIYNSYKMSVAHEQPWCAKQWHNQFCKKSAAFQGTSLYVGSDTMSLSKKNLRACWSHFVTGLSQSVCMTVANLILSLTSLLQRKFVEVVNEIILLKKETISAYV